MKEALKSYLGDLEDIYLAEKRLEDLLEERDIALNSKDFWNDVEG